MNKGNNIFHYLENQAKQHPDQYVFLHPQQISYRDFVGQVNQLATGLYHYGIRPGMKTILLTDANPAFFVLVFALMKLGTVLVLIDPGVGARVMKSSLKSIEADVFIGSDKAYLFRILSGKSFSQIRFNILTGKYQIWKARSLSKLYNDIEPEISAVQVELEDPGGIFFTSGSTGPPKGVIYLNRMFHAQISTFREHYKWNPDEIDFCTFPLIGLFSICLGCSLVLADMNPIHPAGLNPERLWTQINEFGCTHMFASPMVIRKLTEYGLKRGIRSHTFKRVVTAGAPSPPELLKEFKSLLPVDASIHTPYGATEALPVTDISANQIESLAIHPVHQSGICVGKPLEGVTIRIIQISDQAIKEWDQLVELETDQVGEIMVSGPMVTESYYQEEANLMAKVKLNEGLIYHRMGDLGRKDADGNIWFYGRKNHRVTTEKQTLLTIPIEAWFNQIAGVKRSALVGIPSNHRDRQIPVILLEPDNTVSRGQSKKVLIEAKKLAKQNELTVEISHFLIHPGFPVDPRHNAKIFREKLAKWARKRIQKSW